MSPPEPTKKAPHPNRKPDQSKPLGYQQQMDSRIQISTDQGICLALPQLSRALNLSPFEKNVILMALAPEVNVRYSRLYHFLQTGEDSTLGELPTVELALRLLCRNEVDRRQARTQLTGPQSLIQQHIVQLVTPTAQTLLGSYLQLNHDWVNYLLADQPDLTHFPATNRLSPSPQAALTQPPIPGANTLEALGDSLPISLPPLPTVVFPLAPITLQVPWETLILPDPLKAQLHTLVQRLNVQVDEHEPCQRVLLVGERGTGKTTAAVAIATALQQSLHTIDLAQIPATDWPALIRHLQQHPHPLVLIQSAPQWLGRHGLLDRAILHRWFQRPNAQLILFETHYRHTVRARWRQQMELILDFPLPDAAHREQLWKQALQHQIPSMAQRDWVALAKALRLTGSQIHQIANTAQAIATAEQTVNVDITQLDKALAQQGYTWPHRAASRS
jgi:energy-coupling factor transporter ATP-binding protein EcfA2